MPAAARLLPEVGEAQWARLARKSAEKTAEMREEFYPADPKERAAAAMRRAVERAETLYGELAPPQRRVLAAALAESPFDASRWMSEREARQAELQRTVRALQAPAVTPAQRVDGLRALARRSLRSSDPEYRDYQIRLTTFNCRLAADLAQHDDPPATRTPAPAPCVVGGRPARAGRAGAEPVTVVA